MTDFQKTPKTKLKRIPQRGHYDQETVYQILDEALICHVGFAIDGEPFVIPTIHARMGDELLLHGAPASRMLKHISQGNPVCVTITLVDGLVLARSAFHHSMNYRSVVVFGTGRVVEAPKEKIQALNTFVEHVVPGRTNDARGANEKEMNGTLVVAIPIEEASAKIRTGPPVDDEEDYALPIWAGILPLSVTPQSAQADARLLAGVELPNYITDYQRPSR